MTFDATVLLQISLIDARGVPWFGSKSLKMYQTQRRHIDMFGSYLVLVDPFQKSEIGEKEGKEEEKKREKRRPEFSKGKKR